MADGLGTHRQWAEGRDRIWAALFEPLVRARLVIMHEELPDHHLQMASAEGPGGPAALAERSR